MNSAGLSRVVISEEGDRLYTFEYAALITQTSTALVERFATLGLISPINSMLRSRDIARISQILRLRRDLGLNLVGAAMVLDMAEEIAQLRAQLQAYRSRSS
ncbi:chaperone modulator CbpM [Chlorogloeopsis sp. ULAP02]|uniref:chaperone modulator CbpM n=1 Tax=Chlorogloeopsis sp. ULAP02 TaxID=3107926 RepID=UPI003135AA21